MRSALPGRPILITFDDGYRDVFFRASPVLRRLGFRATAYVVSGRISAGDPSFLTWPLLRALERRGIEIGSHTVAHRDLTSLPDGALLEDLRSSRLTLERRLGHPVPWLAYPFGRNDGARAPPGPARRLPACRDDAGGGARLGARPVRAPAPARARHHRRDRARAHARAVVAVTRFGARVAQSIR